MILSRYRSVIYRTIVWRRFRDVWAHAGYRLRRPLRSRSSSAVPFVLLCSPRTGSNYLLDLLRTDPDVRVRGEIFDRVELSRRRWVTARPVAYAAYCLSSPRGSTRAVGFKLFYRHCRPAAYPEIDFRQPDTFSDQTRRLLSVWDYLVGRTDLRVIHLTRRNLVRQYLSLVIARLTWQWLRRPGDRRRHPGRIAIDVDELLRWARVQTDREERHRRLFSRHRVLELAYEDLVEDPSTSLDRIARFFAIPNRFGTASSLVRQNPEPFDRLVSNASHVASKLAEYAEASDELAARLCRDVQHELTAYRAP